MVQTIARWESLSLESIRTLYTFILQLSLGVKQAACMHIAPPNSKWICSDFFYLKRKKRKEKKKKTVDACHSVICFDCWLPFCHISFCIVQLLEKLHEKWSSVEKQPYPAMYSSIYGGIILDPAMMVIPIDDHMVHRGHGVFDTAIIFNG